MDLMDGDMAGSLMPGITASQASAKLRRGTGVGCCH